MKNCYYRLERFVIALMQSGMIPNVRTKNVERALCECGFSGRPDTPRCTGPAHSPRQFLERGVARRIRQSVADGIERERAGGAVRSAFDLHSIDGRRQLTLQWSLFGGSLDVVDDELNDRGHREL
jgi:hypothetical protein